jgi:hypothetical protein
MNSDTDVLTDRHKYEQTNKQTDIIVTRKRKEEKTERKRKREERKKEKGREERTKEMQVVRAGLE